MPELPEVETIVRSLRPRLVGRVVATIEVRQRALRHRLSDDFEDRLRGGLIAAIRRRGKYLIFMLDDGPSWVVHLGMSGRLTHTRRACEPRRHDHVVLGFDDGGQLVFHDPRRFGSMAVVDDVAEVLSSLGPEPLEMRCFSPAYLARLARRTHKSVKEVLMDQRMVAGIGNIYASEILYVAGIRPRRQLARLSRAEREGLVAATRAVLREAVRHRGSSISDFLDGIGRPGGYQWRRRVYDRAGASCGRCGSRIKRIVLGQRSSFYCPSCQH